MRDPYTSNQGSEPGHPDSISPAQVMIPDTTFASFTGRAPGRSYALQFAISVCALGVLLWIGYRMTQPADPGTVMFQTRPPEVTVTIDGKSLTGQVNPITLDDVASKVDHVLEVSKAGFKPYRQTLNLTPGEVKKLEVITLEPLIVESGFTLESTPPGAKVLVDGKALAQVTPVKVTDLAAGEHTLRVEHGFAFKAWEGPLTVGSGEVKALPAITLAALSPMEAKKAERLAKLQAKRDALKAAKAAKAAAAP